jgi:hypothetical protein
VRSRSFLVLISIAVIGLGGADAQPMPKQQPGSAPASSEARQKAKEKEKEREKERAPAGKSAKSKAGNSKDAELKTQRPSSGLCDGS